MKRICGFPPVIDQRAQVLILGSMPGAASLKAQQYYAFARNQFWPIMAKLLKQNSWSNYEQKLKTLQDNHIALWDVIESCRRQGSLDAGIIYAKPNDIFALLRQYPNIQAIFCNGQAAFRLLNKHHPNLPVPVDALPSSSPAHTVGLQNKVGEWRRTLLYLGK